MALLTRRGALLASLGTGGLSMAGCSKVFQADRLTQNTGFHHVLEQAEHWDLFSQRFLLQGGRLATEYSVKDLSPHFKGNGTLHPAGDEYARHLEGGFADWRLVVDGMVARPLSLSLADLRGLPAKTQITRHDCVEGWSAIGQWTGVPLGLLLRAAGASAAARFGVFSCADNLGGEPSKGGEQSPGQYYESLGREDLFHPQTLIAYAMNGAPLPVQNGAPLRLRVERQLGYKHAKYVQRISLVDDLGRISGGKGGYWEDRGYEWYAGM